MEEPLDVEGLKKDLRKYYLKHDPEELENIDDVVDLGLELGISTLNGKLKVFYGESLEEFLDSLRNMPPGVSKLRTAANYIPTRLLPSPTDPSSPEAVDGPSPEAHRPSSKRRKKPKKLSNISKVSSEDEAQLKVALRVFYAKHDRERLAPEAMEKILGVARQLGREGLNEKLSEFYGENLDDIERDEEKVSMRSQNKQNLVEAGRQPRNERKNRKKKERKRTRNKRTEEKIQVPKVNKQDSYSSGESSGSPTPKATANKPKQPLRTPEPILNPAPVVDEFALNEEEQAQLFEDLTSYYNHFDPEKLEVIDDVLEIAMTVGVEELDSKLGHLYGMGFLHFKKYSAAKLEEAKRNERHQPFALPGLTAGEIGQVNLRKVDKPQKQSLNDIKMGRRSARKQRKASPSEKRDRRKTTARKKLESVRLARKKRLPEKSIYQNISDLREVI